MAESLPANTSYQEQRLAKDKASLAVYAAGEVHLSPAQIERRNVAIKNAELKATYPQEEVEAVTVKGLDKAADSMPERDEVLRDGEPDFATLAVHLKEISENYGPAVVNDYLKVALTQDAERMPTSERLAIFEMLASAQEAHIDEELVRHGATMIDQLDTATRQATPDLDQKEKKAKRLVKEFKPRYDQAVVRSARGG